MAPCSAVSPLSSTSFTPPPPTSYDSLSAARASSSVPGFSPGAQMPTPAAAINGRVIFRLDRRIGAVIEKKAHQRQIDGLCRHQERRGTNPIQLVAIAVLRLLFLARVHVGTQIEELSGQI